MIIIRRNDVLRRLAGVGWLSAMAGHWPLAAGCGWLLLWQADRLGRDHNSFATLLALRYSNDISIRKTSGDSRKFYMGWQKGGKLNSRVANHTHKVKSSLFIVGNTHAWCLYVFIYTNR